MPDSKDRDARNSANVYSGLQRTHPPRYGLRFTLHNIALHFARPPSYLGICDRGLHQSRRTRCERPLQAEVGHATTLHTSIVYCMRLNTPLHKCIREVHPQRSTNGIPHGHSPCTTCSRPSTRPATRKPRVQQRCTDARTGVRVTAHDREEICKPACGEWHRHTCLYAEGTRVDVGGTARESRVHRPRLCATL